MIVHSLDHLYRSISASCQLLWEAVKPFDVLGETYTCIEQKRYILQIFINIISIIL